MNKNLLMFFGIAAIAMSFTSCKKDKKEENNDIIVEKVIMKPQTSSEAMPASTEHGQVKWIDGNTYHYEITRAVNPDLNEVESHGVTYADNSIRLIITRQDGSEFVSYKFSKSNLSSYLNDDIKEHGVLLGMGFKSSDSNNLIFSVTVGCPDEGYDDFTIVQAAVSRMGEVTFSPYKTIEE